MKISAHKKVRKKVHRRGKAVAADKADSEEEEVLPIRTADETANVVRKEGEWW